MKCSDLIGLVGVLFSAFTFIWNEARRTAPPDIRYTQEWSIADPLASAARALAAQAPNQDLDELLEDYGRLAHKIYVDVQEPLIRSLKKKGLTEDEVEKTGYLIYANPRSLSLKVKPSGEVVTIIGDEPIMTI